MTLDPRKMLDWEIAEAAEPGLRPVSEIARGLGLRDPEIIPYGRLLAKVDVPVVHARLDAAKARAQALYIDVTAITPTPLGEGKTTAVIGLADEIGRAHV